MIAVLATFDCKSLHLGSDYPMVAPSYAEKRSTLAKSIGLGRKQTDASPKRGRPSKRDAA